VKEIDGAYGAVGTAEMVARNGLVFFTAPSFAEGDDLWRSDGTTAGTFVLEIDPGSASASPVDDARREVARRCLTPNVDDRYGGVTVSAGRGRCRRGRRARGGRARVGRRAA